MPISAASFYEHLPDPKGLVHPYVFTKFAFYTEFPSNFPKTPHKQPIEKTQNLKIKILTLTKKSLHSDNKKNFNSENLLYYQ